ncbi:MAG: ABC transporter ATP-binding protein [Eubacteriales bacterium]|nr:ABC transporter ATP-binding protein [Eubacteriales bacterium]MDD4711454.1 ABC transporter ATP-binding protein [Eubacteriales bacterium]
MLKIENVNLFYGAIHALHDISFHVAPGEIVTLIGANGAGKTSILHAISSLIPYRDGEVIFSGKKLKKLPAYEIVNMGLAHVPEGRRIFGRMTVKENLDMGAYTRHDTKETHADMQRVFQHFPRLKERRGQLAGTLSGGEQQMLSIGRALMSRPKLLMMDEPSMGLSPILVSEIFSIIREINQEGTTVLLVEQNAHMALSVANRGYVLETGRVVLEGAAKALLNNSEVKRAYLGTA